MSIYQKIQKDKLQPGADRPLLSLIMGEICIDGKPMDDCKAITRLSQMVKVCEKNIDLYKKADKFGKALEEASFQNLIKSYLPQGADEQDIESAIIELGIERNMKSMGILMANLKSKFAVVDGNLVKSALMGGSGR